MFFPKQVNSTSREDYTPVEETPIVEVVVQTDVKTTPTKKVETTHLPIAHYKYISSKFTAYHSGVDLVAKKGTKVLAWKSGTVITARYSGNMGNLIEIKHSDGSISRYGHLSAYKIKKGQKVSAGQVIGLVGSTGNATGPHLHFEIVIKGKKVNPLKYI